MPGTRNQLILNLYTRPRQTEHIRCSSAEEVELCIHRLVVAAKTYDPVRNCAKVRNGTCELKANDEANARNQGSTLSIDAQIGTAYQLTTIC